MDARRTRTSYTLNGAARHARQLGHRVSRHQVAGAILRGELRGERPANRIWLIAERDLTRWLRGRASPLDSDAAASA